VNRVAAAIPAPSFQRQPLDLDPVEALGLS